MATIDETGIVTRDLSEWIAKFQGDFRDAFGETLSFDPATLESQIIGIVATAMAEGDESFLDLFAATSISTARGRQLEDNADLLRILRRKATKSRVTLTIAGVAGTNIPATSRVRNDAGALFQTISDTLIPATGSIDVTAEARDEGAVQAAANTLTEIETLVAGWETVNNANAAVPGRAAEADRIFRARYRASTARLASGPIDAIIAALIEAGATAWRVEENDGGAIGLIQGSTTHSNATQLRAISDGSFHIADQDFEGIDLSSTSNFADIATVIQATLRTAFPRAVVTYGSNRFSLSIPDAGDGSEGFEATGSGTDLSSRLGLELANITLTPGVIRIQGFDLPPHSVCAIVRGGLDTDVAAAIRRTKSVGTATFGGPTGDRRTSVSDGVYTTLFRRVNEVPIRISLTISVDDGFPSAGVAAIKTALTEYAVGEWQGGSGQFDTRGFQVGHPIDARRLQTPINSIGGHMVTSLTVADSGGSALPDLPDLDTLYTLAGEHISVTVS